MNKFKLNWIYKESDILDRFNRLSDDDPNMEIVRPKKLVMGRSILEICGNDIQWVFLLVDVIRGDYYWRLVNDGSHLVITDIEPGKKGTMNEHYLFCRVVDGYGTEKYNSSLSTILQILSGMPEMVVNYKEALREYCKWMDEKVKVSL